MSKIFAIVPPPEPLSTTTVVASTLEMPQQTKADEKRGLITTVSALEVVPTPTAPIGIVYVSAAFIQAMAQRLACI